MAALPQNAADPATRAQAVADRASLYNFQIRAGMGMTMLRPLNSVVPEPLGTFDFTNLPLLPPQEEPDSRWYDANEAAVLNSGGSGGLSFIHNMFMNKPLFPFDNQSHEQRLDNFYSAYVDGTGRPEAADRWFTDRSFCQQRLCGANPVKIRRVRSAGIIDDPANCAINASHFGALLDGTTLTTAINTNLVYVCDYAELIPAAGSITGQFGETRYLTAPIAVFFWTQGPDEPPALVPVAIQLERGHDKPVFVPGDQAWRFAKAAVQTADAVVHEVGSHLIRSHAAMEAFPVSAARTFSDDHPLYQLLKPHFRNMLKINSIIGLLTDEGKVIDQLFPVDHAAKAALATRQYNDWSFSRVANPVNEIGDRGMSAGDCPVGYPYRDDAILLWETIQAYVQRYVEHWYPSDDDVVEDFELQNFAHSLIGEGGVRDLLPALDPSNPPTTDQPVAQTRGDLVFLIATVLFTAGPYHSAVNYPQYEEMGWVPNMAFAGYLPPPTNPAADPELPGPLSTIEDHYPPDYATRLQVIVMYVLSYQRYDRLGHYPPDTFDDPEVWDIVAEFQCELAKVEAKITQANMTRPVSYKYLLPHNITNGTSI